MVTETQKLAEKEIDVTGSGSSPDDGLSMEKLMEQYGESSVPTPKDESDVDDRELFEKYRTAIIAIANGTFPVTVPTGTKRPSRKTQLRLIKKQFMKDAKLGLLSKARVTALKGEVIGARRFIRTEVLKQVQVAENVVKEIAVTETTHALLKLKKRIEEMKSTGELLKWAFHRYVKQAFHAKAHELRQNERWGVSLKEVLQESGQAA